jgi:nitrite reductase (NADH) small subunit
VSEWIYICQVSDVPMLGSRRVQRSQGSEVAIFRTEGDRIFALLDRCPHKGGPLSQGIVAGDHVACPLHNWNIAFESGQAHAPDVGCTARFAVHLEGDRIHLDARELATKGLEPLGAQPATCP